MSLNNDLKKFENLTFEDFKKFAKDLSLSPYEKVGFPDTYRKGKEEYIFLDITNKLTNLNKERQRVFDIGPGCSELPNMMVDLCREKSHSLILIDSKEMLGHLPDEPFITKVPCYYPDECGWVFDKYQKSVDVILTYSVLHYVFAKQNLFTFIDRSLSLLSDGGQLLIGDIPNISKRKRFFSSPNGIKYHKSYTGKHEKPSVEFNKLETGKIDDSVVLSLMMHCRSAGFDSYILPQPEGLPMANRREDILIVKP